jgi:23S rRNA pseudouridine1911/1915/1917 synthase
LSSVDGSELRAFVAAEADGGSRLDVVLARHAGLSRAGAQKLIVAGSVWVDGSPARKKHLVRAGERVTWQPPPKAGVGLTAEDVAYALVYEDDWLLVVDKPAGVVVHPAPGHEHGTLAQGLVAKGARGGHESRPGIVHRLDKDTSGLLIVARRDEAYRRLVAAMERRDIHRTYVALLVGDLPQDAGTIDAPIGRHLRDRKRMSLHTAAGKRAVTHFDVLGRAPGFTLMRVRLETGRTHQIRVHFSALGYPVAGDVQYGRPPRPTGLRRQFLHSARLVFPHPRDGREIRCASPLPPDLAAFLETLGLPPQPLG